MDGNDHSILFQKFQYVTAYKNTCRSVSFVSLVVTCVVCYYHFTNPVVINFVSYFINATIVNSEKNLQFEFIFANDFQNNSSNASSFKTSWNIILDELNLLNVRTLNDEKILTSTPIIGTAISSNHVGPYKEFLRSVENFYKNKKLVYLYDLGLKSSERLQLINEFGHIIKEIRNFTFYKYPPYMKNLRQFRWKPLVVADLLKEFPSIWWMDASVRILKPLNHFYKVYNNCTTKTCKFYPWILTLYSGHSIFAATDKRMYEYLPMPIELSKKVTMWGATVQLIFATKEIRENVLRYWVLCALEEGCMDPPGSVIECRFTGDRFAVHAGCNRQDQSAINIILSNVNNFTEVKYSRDAEGVLDIIKDNVFYD